MKGQLQAFLEQMFVVGLVDNVMNLVPVFVGNHMDVTLTEFDACPVNTVLRQVTVVLPVFSAEELSIDSLFALP